MAIFYIYAHYTKDTNELFYIGKGSGKRWQHRTRRNLYWHNIVNKHGYYNKFLAINLSENYAYKIEKLAINKLNPKANLSIGGLGGAKGVKRSKETIRKMKSAQKFAYLTRGRKIICETDQLCFYSLKLAADYYNTHKSSISKVANNQRNSWYGKTFDYIKEY